MKVCIIGASGKLGQYMVQHCLDRGYGVHGVCREKSVAKLDAFADRIKVFAGPTNDQKVVAEAAKGCDGVLVVLAPWGVQDYSSGTARAALESSEEGARLIFSCGWHISKDGKDVYSKAFKGLLAVAGWVARTLRFVDIADQVRACDMIFSSDKKWTVVRGSDLEEGESQGIPVWSDHVQDPILASNKTRRIDFALFMVEALKNDSLIHKAPAICGRQTHSAQTYGNNQ